MNSFGYKFGKWLKDSSLGLIITSIALVFVIAVSFILSNQNKPVGNVESESQVAVEDNSSSIQTTYEKIHMPFSIDAKVARYFFEADEDISIRSNAIIHYDNKYLPSLGVDYTYNNEEFTILSSFSGKVVSKVNDSLYGLSLVIENEKGLRAHYCGLSKISVLQGQNVAQGQIVGEAGESIINASLGKHLHFALEYQSTYLNPLKHYDKYVNDIH